MISGKTEEKVNHDREYAKSYGQYVMGIDEVGRGPLAGPVVCAGVIMPLDDENIIDGIDDSKKLSIKKREALAEEIKKKAISYVICQIENDEIDEINILEATKKCMISCVDKIETKPDLVLVDAVKLNIECKTEAIIKGDIKSYNIGAASIIAKVYRDKLMDEYDEIYPEYGFSKNKGYGTKAHIDALKEIGYCKIHRKTFIKNFSGVKERV